MTEPTSRRADLLERFERATEVPLLVLAVLMLPMLVAPVAVELSTTAERGLATAEWVVWAAFAAEYVIRLVLSPARWRFVRRHWPDLLIVVLPFLRPLRIVRSARALRALRLVRLATFLAAATRDLRRLFVRHHLHHVLLATAAIVAGAALLVLAVEDDGAQIDSAGDALWWAITTVTTVGYGDTVPASAAGRVLAAGLMVVGIALFGVLTANLAAFLMERGEHDEQPNVDTALADIAARLERIERRLVTLDAPTIDLRAPAQVGDEVRER